MTRPSTSPIYNVAVSTSGPHSIPRTDAIQVIGAGEVAMTVHVSIMNTFSSVADVQLPTLLLHSHMYRVVALVDVSREALAHCSAKFHIPYTYNSVCVTSRM
jgi:hypothetical protein